MRARERRGFHTHTNPQQLGLRLVGSHLGKPELVTQRHRAGGGVMGC